MLKFVNPSTVVAKSLQGIVEITLRGASIVSAMFNNLPIMTAVQCHVCIGLLSHLHCCCISIFWTPC